MKERQLFVDLDLHFGDGEFAYIDGSCVLRVRPEWVGAIRVTNNISGYVIELDLQGLKYPILIQLKGRSKAIALADSIERQLQQHLSNDLVESESKSE